MPNRHALFSFNCQQRKERFSCVKCLDILVEPYQCNCGCRFCHCCILPDEEKDKSEDCPYCNEYQGAGQRKFCQDKAIEKEIFESEVHCKNKNCENLCKFKDLVEHMEICEETEEHCKSCGKLFPLKEMARHKNVECEMIKVKCKDCGVEITQKYRKEKHNNMNGDDHELCDRWKEVCPYQCSLEVQDSLKVHFITCKRRARPCIMSEIGCLKTLNNAEMTEHVNNDMLEHYVMMLNMLKVNKEENKELLIQFTESTLKKEEEINNLEQMSISNAEEVKILTESIKVLGNKYDNLRLEASYIRRAHVKVERLSERHGSYTWTIEDIDHKIEDAKNGLNLQIYSEGFYTASRGYKMLLKIYPNGDGKGLGKHISVYFLIAKGKYDDEVVWPFNKNVSITLIHNDNARSNRIVKMRPDLNESCYGKPVREYNVAAGQPTFINHTDLISTRQYVRNGSITVITEVT